MCLIRWLPPSITLPNPKSKTILGWSILRSATSFAVAHFIRYSCSTDCRYSTVRWLHNTVSSANGNFSCMATLAWFHRIDWLVGFAWENVWNTVSSPVFVPITLPGVKTWQSTQPARRNSSALPSPSKAQGARIRAPKGFWLKKLRNSYLRLTSQIPVYIPVHSGSGQIGSDSHPHGALIYLTFFKSPSERGTRYDRIKEIIKKIKLEQ